MDFALIILVYAPARLPSTRRIANHIISRVRPRQVIVVINGDLIPQEDVVSAFQRVAGVEIIRHDNTGQEFGGYQAGLDRLKENTPERLIVMNDTAGTYDVITPAYISQFVHQLSGSINGLAVGRIDVSERSYLFGGHRASRWIRTHFFGMDHVALKALENRLYWPEIDELITASAQASIFFSGIGDGILKRQIENWLFVPTAYSWRSAKPLDESNHEAMARKARAILQEKNLTLQLECSEIAIQPVYFSRQKLLAHYTQKSIQVLARKLAVIVQGSGFNR